MTRVEDLSKITTATANSVVYVNGRMHKIVDVRISKSNENSGNICLSTEILNLLKSAVYGNGIGIIVRFVDLSSRPKAFADHYTAYSKCFDTRSKNSNFKLLKISDMTPLPNGVYYKILKD